MSCQDGLGALSLEGGLKPVEKNVEFKKPEPPVPIACFSVIILEAFKYLFPEK